MQQLRLGSDSGSQLGIDLHHGGSQNIAHISTEWQELKSLPSP
jgi:hypothetical protein